MLPWAAVFILYVRVFLGCGGGHLAPPVRMLQVFGKLLLLGGYPSPYVLCPRWLCIWYLRVRLMCFRCVSPTGTFAASVNVVGPAAFSREGPAVVWVESVYVRSLFEGGRMPLCRFFLL